jgi:glutathione S-transferase
MITIYHLGVSQSDRIVWLMEELDLPYRLEWFDRGADMMAPPPYRALHPMGTAPTIRDGDLVLGEAAAIVEYIINRHGGGRLGVAKDQPNYPDYLYWMSFSGSFQANIALVRMAKNSEEESAAAKRTLEFAGGREQRFLAFLDKRLGESPYLGGPELTGADIMNVFNLTTWPMFGGPSVDHLPNVAAYIDRIRARPAYQKAMAIAGPLAKKPASSTS